MDKWNGPEPLSKVGMVRCSQTHLILKDLKIQNPVRYRCQRLSEDWDSPHWNSKVKTALVVKLIKNTKTLERSVNENKTSTWPLERNPEIDFWELWKGFVGTDFSKEKLDR